MTTLPNTGLILPTRGVGGAGVWDDTLDADLALIDAHDHSTGKGTPVKTNGISIDADLTFSSLYAPINLHRLTFASIVALSSNNKSLFVNTADNELYWRSNAGTNVKLTSGSALNVAAFTGGIGGDYTSVSAAVAFDDAGDRYTFKQNSGTGWARLACGDVRLFETGTSDAVFVGLAAPAALAASYTVTMPLAAPTAGARPVQMSTSGVLTAGDSDNVTVGGNATVAGTLGVTGATTLTGGVSGTLSVTGLIFGQNGITSAVNTHITVSGTGQYKHGTKTLILSHYDFDAATGTHAAGGMTGSPLASGLGASVTLPAGKRILAVRLFIQDNATGPTTYNFTLTSLTSTGTSATVATSGTSAGSGANQTLSVTGLTTTIAASTNYSIIVTNVAGAGASKLYGAEVDYDEP